jgi:hypothetical protein
LVDGSAHLPTNARWWAKSGKGISSVFSILGPKFRTSFLSGNRALTDRHTFI